MSDDCRHEATIPFVYYVDDGDGRTDELGGLACLDCGQEKWCGHWRDAHGERHVVLSETDTSRVLVEVDSGMEIIRQQRRDATDEWHTESDGSWLDPGEFALFRRYLRSMDMPGGVNGRDGGGR